MMPKDWTPEEVEKVLLNPLYCLGPSPSVTERRMDQGQLGGNAKAGLSDIPTDDVSRAEALLECRKELVRSS
jgi:hypothetical protein